jgi:hypothetical protein
MKGPLWSRDGTHLKPAGKTDWHLLTAHEYNFLFDDEPPHGSESESTWWMQLWNLPVTAWHEERYLGYIRSGNSTPDNLVTRVQAGFLDLVGDRTRLEVAMRLFIGLVMWHLPVNRLHMEIPLSAQHEYFAQLSVHAGFVLEAVYPRYKRNGSETVDVVVLGCLREDLMVVTSAR